MDEIELRELSRATIQRYGARYSELGVSPGSLGWGSSEDQQIRFEAVTSVVDLTDRSILDWGCGFGDLFAFLIKKGVRFASYTGADLTPVFVNEARKRFSDDPRATFHLVEPSRPFPDPGSSDVVIMLGLANFEQAVVPTVQYARQLLEAGYHACTEAVVCDFLSGVHAPDYPPESVVHYYDPAEVLSWALELSPNVLIKHDYPPIPQREMMVKVSRPRGER